jgi:hypothetical protein
VPDRLRASLQVLLLLSPLAAGTAEAAAVRFVDRAAEAGLDFVHDNGMRGERQFLEVMGSGAAMLDCDGDGDLDVLLRQAGPADGSGQATDRLFRNDLRNGRLRFTDVTAGSGLDVAAVGMGVAAGDFDNDGHVDLYLTNFGANRLLRNRGGCRFEDVTAAAGAGDDRWSVPATFFDFDRDGWLDLFVGNYVDFDPRDPKRCFAKSSALDYCGPESFGPLPDRLLHNRGGRFEDVTQRAGLAVAPGRALGAIAFDADGDGWTDLFVGNDSNDNNLWINQRDGTFRDRALELGCALNSTGIETGDMGVDAADIDGDGDDDLISTHFRSEGVSVWLNQGQGQFRDLAAPSGLMLPTRHHTGFGTAWFDADGDGLLDVYFANGAVQLLDELVTRGDPFPIWEPNQLFLNLGRGRFRDVTAEAGPEVAGREASRGVAFGDVDNDGDIDLLIANSGARARLLINETEPRASWVGLRLRGGEPERDLLGAVAHLELADGSTLVRRARADGSYASAHDPRVLFGLGPAGAPPLAVVVQWPDGERERFPPPPVGRFTDLVRGRGSAMTAPP